MKTSLKKLICLSLAIQMIVIPEMILAQEPAAKERARATALKLIPPNATAALIAHPRAALTGPNMEAIPHEIISAFGRQELGIDPMEIQLAVAAVEFHQNQRPDGAVALKFRQPISLEDLSPNLTRGAAVEELNGKPYIAAGDGISFYLPTDTVLLVGTEPMIQAMMKRAGTPNGSVHKHLSTGKASDLQLVVAMDSVRDMVNGQLSMAPPLPGALDRLKELPEHTEAVELRVDTTPFTSEFALHGIDGGATDEIEQILKRAINTGKLMAQEAARYNIDGDGEIEQASLAYSNRMIDMVAERFAPARQGNKVSLGGEVQAEVMVIGTLVAHAAASCSGGPAGRTACAGSKQWATNHPGAIESRSRVPRISCSRYL